MTKTMHFARKDVTYVQGMIIIFAYTVLPNLCNGDSVFLINTPDQPRGLVVTVSDY